MIKFGIGLILFLLAACNNSTENQFSKADNYFIDALLNKKKPRGKTIVYVLNQSACQPCEERVKELIEIDFGSANKLFVVDSKRKPSEEEENNFIILDKTIIDKSGMTRAHGAVLLFINETCLLIESIDVNNIESLADTLRKVMNEKI